MDEILTKADDSLWEHEYFNFESRTNIILERKNFSYEKNFESEQFG
jgi:hypothetical protein